MKKNSAKTVLAVLGMMVMTMASNAEPAVSDISLPVPRMEGGKPLMTALKDRQTARSFSPKALPLQVVSDLLWAANGINRADSGKRTAPTALNWQEIDVYVVLEQGAYLYDAKANSLKAVVSGDIRKATGSQGFVATAPVNLVFTADTTKMKGVSAEEQTLLSAADTGYVSQNVYLFCASEGLSTVVRGSFDQKTLAEALKLPGTKKIILAQTVGYPAAEAR